MSVQPQLEARARAKGEALLIIFVSTANGQEARSPEREI